VYTDGDNQRLFIAKWAFLLALGGVLVPLLIAMLTLVSYGQRLAPETVQIIALLAIGFGCAAEILALVLGVVAWQQLLGKIAAVASGVLIALAGLGLAAVVPFSVVERSTPGSSVVAESAVEPVDAATSADGVVASPIATGIKVPDDFPKDLPVYPRATPIVHQSIKEGRYLQLTTSDAADKVTTFYREKLKAEGWKQLSESPAESPKSGITLLQNTKDNRRLSVVVAHDDKETTLTLSMSIDK
jgi:hypothetical protein